MRSDDFVPVLIVMTVFGTVGWIVQTLVDGYRRRERLRVFTDFHTRLIDRMGSAKEFGDFLQTQGGQHFLDTLSIERGHPLERIMRAVQIGIILTVVGGALFMAGRYVAVEIEGGYVVFATVIMALGVGFLLSSVASFVLARTFGLTNRLPPQEAMGSRTWPESK